MSTSRIFALVLAASLGLGAPSAMAQASDAPNVGTAKTPTPTAKPKATKPAKSPAAKPQAAKPQAAKQQAAKAGIAAATAAIPARPSIPAIGRALPTPLQVASAAPVGKAAPSPSNAAYGAFQRGLYLTAKAMAEPLANLGDPAAQALLGEIYSRGLGLGRDDTQAARWYEAAAKAGSAEGQFRLALMLIDGKGIAKDPARSRTLMKSAADAGIAQAQYNYAQMAIQASPTSGFTDAKPYFEKAANAGVADAQYAMSQVYAYGRGLPAPDDAKAREWLTAAAINGYDTAQIELGIWMINGKGGPKASAEGARWLRRAAGRGNPIAMNRTAHLYMDGIGVKADKIEAAKWSVLARRADNADSVLDDFFRKLDETTQREALDAANRFRAG